MDGCLHMKWTERMTQMSSMQPLKVTESNLLVYIRSNFLNFQFFFAPQKSFSIGNIKKMNSEVEIDRGLPPQFKNFASVSEYIFLKQIILIRNCFSGIFNFWLTQLYNTSQGCTNTIRKPVNRPIRPMEATVRTPVKKNNCFRN